MRNLPGLSPLWLMFFALALGVVIVTFLPFAISGGETVKSSDWIGFAGGIVGAAVTLIAAIVAWLAVQRQIRAEADNIRIASAAREQEKGELQENARRAAVVVLNHPVFSAARVLGACNKIVALKAQDTVGTATEFNAQWEALNRLVDILKAALEHFAVAQAWQDLGTNDKGNYLMIVSTLQATVSIHISTAPVTRQEKTRLAEVDADRLEAMAIYLGAFDAKLTQSFRRRVTA